jgi:hypothetical protein
MTDVSNRSGGADFPADEVDVGGDVMGCDTGGLPLSVVNLLPI